uniref:Uncharacterized protein n=1 Tax=Oryza punctata TaxID=4537 RepID=A0A0E0KIP3_ORYPU
MHQVNSELSCESETQLQSTRTHGFLLLQEAVAHLRRRPPRRARRARRDGGGRDGGGLLDCALHPGRVHHLQELPGEEARRLRLPVRAQRRRPLRPPPPRRLLLQVPRAQLN